MDFSFGVAATTPIAGMAGPDSCIVLPKLDAVVAITANTNDMQAELDVVWDKLLPAMHDEPLPEDEAGVAKLKDAVAKLEASQ